jgi:hypothetical protein
MIEHVLDRVLGRPKPARRAPERDFALEAAAESAREKLAQAARPCSR